MKKEGLVSPPPEKSFYKRLTLLALPIIGQDLLNASVNMLDTFMVGSLGETSITAVGLANQFFFVYIMFVFGISSGCAILMSQYFGMKDIKSIRKTVGLGIFLSSLIAVLASLLAITRPELVLSIYSKDPAVIAAGAKYLRIVGVTYLFGAFTVPISTSLKSMNMPKYPMFITATTLTISVTLNYILIIVLDFGVVGAACSTLTARSIELVMLFVVIKKFKLPLAGNIKDFLAADKEFFMKYLRLATPVVFAAIMWSVGTSLYNVAYKHCGTQAQAAVQITGAIQNLFWVIGMGIGSAAGIILANVLGAGEREKAILYSKKIIRVVIPAGIIMGLAFLLTSPLIAGLFNVSDEVKVYSLRITYVLSVMITIRLVNFTTIVGILRSGGDTFFCMIAELVAVWLFAVPLAFLGAYFLKLPIYWVVLMVQAEDIIKLFTMTPRRLTNKWARTLV
jgi:putative MATE family efflux protein